MKKYLTSNEIAHVWVSGNRDTGSEKPSAFGFGSCGHGSRQHFEGDRFYSYSTVIAKRFKTKRGKPVYVIDFNSYSPTTRKHQAGLRDAMGHWCPVENKHVSDHIYFRMDYGPQLWQVGPEDVIKWYVSEATRMIVKAQDKHVRFRDDLYVQADHMMSEARRFAKLMGLKTGRMPSVSKKERAIAKEAGDKWKADCKERRDKAYETKCAKWKAAHELIIKESIERAELLIAGRANTNLIGYDYFGYEDSQLASVPELKAKVQAWRAERDKEMIEKWKAGENVHTRETWPTMLRVVAQDIDGRQVKLGAAVTWTSQIETSRGARFSVDDGKRAFEFVQLVVKRGKPWRRNGEQFKIGDYQLDSVTETGDVVAGCHRIKHDEIMRFAKLMGWV